MNKGWFNVDYSKYFSLSIISTQTNILQEASSNIISTQNLFLDSSIY